jgi:hypothetical protein
MTIKNHKLILFVCGDSFCFPDPDYGLSWVDLIQKSRPNIEIINLSSPGASNYLISLQVQHALKNNCDRIIYHATSSIRQEFSIAQHTATKDSINRYWNLMSKNNKSVVSASWISATRYTDELLSDEDQIIKKFFTEYIDLPSMINKNYIFIDYTLKLLDSFLPRSQWAWSPGGFENKKFSDSISWDFANFQDRMCKINLWDDYDNSKMRPYYHVTDPTIHQRVCELYLQMLDL